MSANITHGMNIDAVQRMVGVFNQEASKLQDIMTRLEQTVRENIDANWRGADAKRFESEWQGTLKAQLNNVKNKLDEASQRATTNIQQQTDASA